ncbi:expressed unknown protein [Seminavis robusta]|uniref:Uncharacterized protein n=1 Tax=Seminavis robusta TaxID=568900 RepID=A0A9N8HLN4_9STRA|nr:expressed unknown protein [Seminavis robusta]|eukprot:Sro822_g207481.1  (109) ;mRNA; f:25400-25726
MTDDFGTLAKVLLFWDGAGDTTVGSIPIYLSNVAWNSNYALKTWNSFSKTFSASSDTAATSHTLTIGMNMQASRSPNTCEPSEGENGMGNKYILRIDNNFKVTRMTTN